MRRLRGLGSLDFLDWMLGAMERESGLVVVGDGRILAEGAIGPVQRPAGGRPVPGARLRATHPAHVGGKRVFAQANLDFQFGVMRVVEAQVPFHIFDACATLVQIGHRELDRDHLSAPAPVAGDGNPSNNNTDAAAGIANCAVWVSVVPGQTWSSRKQANRDPRAFERSRGVSVSNYMIVIRVVETPGLRADRKGSSGSGGRFSPFVLRKTSENTRPPLRCIKAPPCFYLPPPRGYLTSTVLRRAPDRLRELTLV